MGNVRATRIRPGAEDSRSGKSAGCGKHGRNSAEYFHPFHLFFLFELLHPASPPGKSALLVSVSMWPHFPERPGSGEITRSKERRSEGRALRHPSERRMRKQEQHAPNSSLANHV
jgi:hypothetical protein